MIPSRPRSLGLLSWIFVCLCALGMVMFLLSLVQAYAWFFTWIPGPLWPLRWENGAVLVQLFGWALFLVPLSMPFFFLWNLLRWWATGGPWVVPDNSMHRLLVQQRRRDEWQALHDAVEAQRPR